MPRSRQVEPPPAAGSATGFDEPFRVRSLALGLSRGASIDGHTHDWPQFVFAASGTLTVEAERAAWVVPPLRALWVPPGVEHRLVAETDTALRTLYFDVGLVAAVREEGGAVAAREESGAAAAAHELGGAAAAREESGAAVATHQPGGSAAAHEDSDASEAAAPVDEDPSVGSHRDDSPTAAAHPADTPPPSAALAWPTPTVLHVEPLLRELVLHVVRIGMLDDRRSDHRHLIAVLVDRVAAAPAAPLALPLPTDPRARRVADQLRGDPGSRAALEDLAIGSGASARTIERTFTRETGMTFGAWRRQLRLVVAVRRLAEGATVTEAALDAGYDSTSAFIAMFRSALGTTPGKFVTDAKGG